MCATGRFCRIEFQSADAQAAAVVTLYDDDGTAITLASNERLMIDSLAMFAVAAVTSAHVFDDRDADGNVDAGEIIAAFGNGQAFFDGGPEGFPCKIAANPKVKAAAAGIVCVTGSGHIVKSGDVNTNPAWK